MDTPSIPLIALAPTAWDGPWRNRQHILTRMAWRGWRVLYSNGPLSWWDQGTSAWRNAPLFGRFIDRQSVSIYVQGRFPFGWPSWSQWDGWVVRRHARDLARRVGGGPFIVCLYHPSLWPLAASLKARWLVYYTFDNYSKERGWSSQLTDAERAALGRADLIVATTDTIAADLPGAIGGQVRILANGVDFQGVVDLASERCPASLAAVPSPRIGYCGVLNRKLDFVLVEQVALHRPDWHWVFIGPTLGRRPGRGDAGDRVQEEAWQRCERLANVHFLGVMSWRDLMASLHHMDVNVICNRADAGWWQDAYPLKFHEYLAAGRPVVSSRIRSLLPFAAVAEFGDGFDAWIGALERAIGSGGVGSIAERRAVAQANDWEDRVDRFEGWLRELVGPGAPGREGQPNHE